MSSLTELKSRMEYIRFRLEEIEQQRNYHLAEMKRLYDEGLELRQEGLRLGNQFKKVRQEQKDAVEFVEGLIT